MSNLANELTALMMLSEGYHVDHVIEITGVELNNFPLDEEGYGWPFEDGADLDWPNGDWIEEEGDEGE